MTADLLKRVVRAIASGSQEDLEKLASRIIEGERRTGHRKLAEELQTLLSKSGSQKVVPFARNDSDRSLRELPLSKRRGDPLVTLIPHDALEHHMVLLSEVESRFARIEKEYAARERLTSFGLRPRKTILLYGPPGCGKSLGAKRLAFNIGLPVLKVKFDALISSYFGESASNLRSIFSAANEYPCVLLLDECDFIARSRVAAKDIGEASRIVNSLLQLMEDYNSPGLLVATTNIESSLDAALFRRFDEVFQVPLPGIVEIEKLLRITLSSINTEAIDWHLVGQRLLGCSAAMVVKTAQDAAKAAVLSGQKRVEMSHLMDAIDDLRRTEHDTSNH